MLHLLLGTAGTGKTTRLMDALKAAVEGGSKAILLVPEQYSFEAERLLISTLGERLALEVEVLSFTRLAGSVFRRFGGLAGVAVTDAGKLLLMSVALGELRDELAIYRKSAVNSAFLGTMIQTCSELKTAGLSPDRLREISGICPESPLRDKLSEIALVYQAYQSLLERGYTDPEDDLLRAESLLKRNNFFAGTQVFVDGFTTFMAAEFALLEHAIAQSQQIYFAMTTDELRDSYNGIGVFSTVKLAANRLVHVANQAGVAVASPVVLTEHHRSDSPALAHLSAHFLQPGAKVFAGEWDERIHIYPGEDLYGECEYVAATIAALVREKAMRYSDIALVARDAAPYLRAVQSSFSRYDIPLFCDDKEEAENLPLFGGVTAALDAVRSNFDPEAVLLFAKSPLTGQAPEEVAALENYCYSWGVRGAVWQLDFANNPRGLAEELTEKDIQLLNVINRVRRGIMDPLLKLREVLKACDGRGFATGIFAFLQEIHATENLTAYAQGLEQGERESFLDSSALLWDELMRILDVFGAVLGGVSLSSKRAWELFRLAVNAVEVGQIPQTLDQVLLGQADRIRPGEKRVVFVVGANEGVFPPTVSTSGLFTDAERRQMLELGAELSAPALEKSVLEKYFAYFAFTLAGERLYVSYPRSDLKGNELLPSMLVSALRAMFPALEPDNADALYRTAGEKSAFAQLSRGWRQDTPMTATLLAFFRGGGKERVLVRMDKAAKLAPHKLMDRQAARALFGDRLRLSPSKVERFYRCPFSYFAADGLGLKKRKKVEFSPLESGSVIHNVLQVMLQRHGGKGLGELSDAAMEREIREIIQAYLAQRIEDMDVLPLRFRYLFDRLCGMLTRLLKRLGAEFAQSEYEVAAVELPINLKEGVKPLELRTADGATVLVEGVVDRVDVMEKNGRRYVRVVDYKSGIKEFKLHDILYGLNMQMLLYLFTIRENGAGALANAIPAGVLYMPVRESFVAAERDTDDNKVAAAREKQWKMNGLLLEDEDSLRGMERDVAGVFIPAKLKKDGSLDAKSALATPAEMGKLADKVKELIVELAGSLSAGEIAAKPALGGDYDACAYCDYRAVCGHEPGDAVRDIASVDKAEFFKLLEAE